MLRFLQMIEMLLLSPSGTMLFFKAWMNNSLEDVQCYELSFINDIDCLCKFEEDIAVNPFCTTFTCYR